MYIALVTGYILPSILPNNSKIATPMFMHEPKQLGKKLLRNSNLVGVGVNEMLFKMIVLSF